MSNPAFFTDTPAAVFLLLVALIVVWFFVQRSRKLFSTVYQWEHGLLYVNGQFRRELPAGRYRIFSLLSQRDVFQLRKTEQVHQSPVIDVASQDKLVFRLAAQVKYRIADPRLAHENNHVEQIGTAIQSALANMAAQQNLGALIGDRAAAETKLLTLMPSSLAGCEIMAVLISTITLPPELRRLFVEIERAKLEGQVALERARGEHAALRSLANAAGLLKDNPDLMNLRLLQSVATVSGKGQLTLVVGQEGMPAGRRAG